VGRAIHSSVSSGIRAGEQYAAASGSCCAATTIDSRPLARNAQKRLKVPDPVGRVGVYDSAAAEVVEVGGAAPSDSKRPS
jgi:hypothetical protein